MWVGSAKSAIQMQVIFQLASPATTVLWITKRIKKQSNSILTASLHTTLYKTTKYNK